MKKIKEKQIVNLWKEQVSRQQTFTDAEGKNLEVVYPGRLNDGRGADFRDAMIKSSGCEKKGCIEIHTYNGCWEAHGHHRDPVYNQVVLHVAWKQDNDRKTILQNQQEVPTVILEKTLAHLKGKTAGFFNLPCKGAKHNTDPEFLLNFLEKTGSLRFKERALRYKNEWSSIKREQSFYQGFLEALGYSKNKEPFLELAGRVPLDVVTSIIQNQVSEQEGLDNLQAFLLGQAGFLPSQRPGFKRNVLDDYVQRLEKLWRSYGISDSMSYRQWELFKVRPGNHPVRRIIALSILLFRYHKTGLFESLLDILRGRVIALVPARLEAALAVKVSGYWAQNFDFSQPLTVLSPILLGRQRAADIVINVLLPFVAACSREYRLGQIARQLYDIYPRLEVNSIERHMLQQLGCNGKWIKTARRQQGLLYIYKTLCTQGKCRECRLGFQEYLNGNTIL